ncbi:2Fe-2S iron-sulfur cluster-binding protein [Hyphomicrobium zavarzinii]|jgi:2Fe-2S ferredoxin|uniref:2Fe-2S iron-sulfur cluster-binding protein n=1 Tax=Hyphomicrobium zavarzinii TaxID=48292 RepID=UPI00037BEB7F|nr:2Fe-2S iron-sulfur cluster-binding protein [Hyphomicrobium zavarzinii]
MPKITYIVASGATTEIDVASGTSVMRAALQTGVPGILAECGGNTMCATCHVYVEESQLSLLSTMTAEEDALLDGVAADRRPNSRLSCQINMSPVLDGLRVYLPERQT